MKLGRSSVLVAVVLLGVFGQILASLGVELQFQITAAKGLVSRPESGRLFVILARTNQPEPRMTIGRSGSNAPIVLARDVVGFSEAKPEALDKTAFISPVAGLDGVVPREFFVQALLDSNTDERSPNSPGNLYSKPNRVAVRPNAGILKLELSQRIPQETPPVETAQIRYVKIQSRLLSEFHHRPIFLRAGIILPRDFEKETARKYPLWIRIGGLNERYTSVQKLMEDKADFREAWMGGRSFKGTLLQLDGTGPNGDPYYINSANNGPYGDALVQELIPYVEAKFRGIGEPRSRVLSGTSTGGWVALALQMFYPEMFNGAWAACPDPVDFRALELINIYEDRNAYVNRYGNERPSERTASGDVVDTVRQEVAIENLLGRANCYTTSGQQWGEWTAAFSPRGPDGLPAPLFDPATGAIDREVANQWKKYDLRIVLEQNWKTLGSKLRGKLHIASGEADGYFLNNAVHLLDQSLSKLNPAFEGSIVYGPGKGHGWSNLSVREMMEQMKTTVEE